MPTATTTESTISSAELAERLPEILDRVRGGERVIVERDGEPIATLVPPSTVSTLGAFVARLDRLEWPDDDFAADLRASRAAQPLIRAPAWPE